MSERFFDTNIIIDMLHDRPAAWAEVRNVGRAWISRMTWIEVMSGVPDAAASETEEFLRLFAMSEIDEEIARRAADLRHQRKSLKAPDAIILASAQVAGRILVTRNTKDFPARMPGIRVPYSL
ncbi:type II toxin-antitoxin system VapC family toxin [Alteriqipengyuania flavescens]|uniref:type II toxin-antitoxin system VapC family toxin n=1 Tax=Alteriqipengyuania flavescens TaxID=3053610 RepID=UPI0025B49E8D|nr:type II toxin-antitoxin system VapC family toxin [Alteriqipengyuania flavescens]WJY18936.1 type II toxin-antitoxin system VapC family toxin [Alteriqipengyuania flavescens]WJY24876.1 type II toxin-antitoxin system VapC family toxin [Alteriqipengyuania flavescens]